MTTTRALLAATVIAFVGLSTSCGSDGGGKARLMGQATFPNSVGGGPVANTDFIVVDLEKGQGADPVAQGTTDANGNFDATVAQSTAMAVIMTGMAPNGKPVRVSGLLNAKNLGFTAIKGLNGATDIACQAGLTAVFSFSIAVDLMDGTRINNLELAGAQLVGQTDFTNGDSVTSSANRARQLTNDGANAP